MEETNERPVADSRPPDEAFDVKLDEDRPHGGEFGPTPGDQLRALPAEAQDRGTRFVSAEAMQARLFSVYDAAAAAEEALALVQQQLTLTLQRHYYEAEEIEQMADELDALLILGGELDDEGLAAGI